MREAIERVIAELEKETTDQKEMFKLYGVKKMTHLASLAMEYIQSHEQCISKLKAVIADEINNPGGTSKS